MSLLREEETFHPGAACLHAGNQPSALFGRHHPVGLSLHHKNRNHIGIDVIQRAGFQGINLSIYEAT